MRFIDYICLSKYNDSATKHKSPEAGDSDGAAKDSPEVGEFYCLKFKIPSRLELIGAEVC
jgi:hypothetical protein